MCANYAFDPTPEMRRMGLFVRNVYIKAVCFIYDKLSIIYF
jgi:hypothetical protein